MFQAPAQALQDLPPLGLMGASSRPGSELAPGWVTAPVSPSSRDQVWPLQWAPGDSGSDPGPKLAPPAVPLLAEAVLGGGSAEVGSGPGTP